MTCNTCGAFVPEGAAFCGNCGAAWDGTAFSPPAAATGPQPISQKAANRKLMPVDAPAGLDRRSFVRKYAVNRKQCSSAAIIGYICAGISIALILTQTLGYMNIFSLIEIVPMVLLCVLLHVLKSRVCAILLLAYSVYNTVASLIISGAPGGWWLIIAGVIGVIGAFGCQKEWKRYQEAQAAAENGMAAGV